MSARKKSFNDSATPSAIDQIMAAILDDRDRDEVPDALYEQAVQEGLAKRFSFCITAMDPGLVEEGQPTFYTTIYPTERDETFKCPSFIRPIVKGQGYDECMVTEWYFKEQDTPAKVVRHLQSLGLVWDEKAQKHDRKLYKALKAELEGAQPPAPGR